MSVRALARTGLLVSALLLAACASEGAAKPPTGAGLPMWEGHAVQVFDDNIDPAAVGLSMDGASPRSDMFLRERSQTADLTARVRVQTVTVDTVGDQKIYHLGVQVGLPTLSEGTMKDRTVELSIKPASLGFPVARAFDSRLQGKTFIGFVRRFTTPEGDVELHWHLAPDTADVAAAVKEAVALKGIGVQQ